MRLNHDYSEYVNMSVAPRGGDEVLDYEGHGRMQREKME